MKAIELGDVLVTKHDIKHLGLEVGDEVIATPLNMSESCDIYIIPFSKFLKHKPVGLKMQRLAELHAVGGGTYFSKDNMLSGDKMSNFAIEKIVFLKGREYYLVKRKEPVSYGGLTIKRRELFCVSTLKHMGGVD